MRNTIINISLTLILCCSFTCDCFNNYRASVTSVYDGDTVTLTVDQGLGSSRVEKIRLYGINAPELRGSERTAGLVSRDSLRAWVLGKDITLETIDDKRGKYGRLLGVLHIDGVNINQKLVQSGLAKTAKY